MNFVMVVGESCSTSPCKNPSTSMKPLSFLKRGWHRLSMSLFSSPVV